MVSLNVTWRSKVPYVWWIQGERGRVGMDVVIIVVAIVLLNWRRVMGEVRSLYWFGKGEERGCFFGGVKAFVAVVF